jgi:hypothetical protein
MREIVWAYHDDSHATHQPLLSAVAEMGRGRILEFGAGYYSTPILYDVVHRKKGRLMTFESDAKFVGKFFDDCDMHFTIMDVNWDTFWNSPMFDAIAEMHWDLIFVDQAPWEARHDTIKRLKHNADFFVLHDCGYFFKNDIFQPEDYFDDYLIWTPDKPWPYISGPQTLLASNCRACDEVVVTRK